MARIGVIGAGIGGMACAARLAARGHDVTVFDAADHTGGSIAGFRHGAYTFDSGPATLTLPAAFRDLFLKTGRPLEDTVELIELDEAARFQFDDGRVVALPGTGVARTTRAVSESLGRAAGEQWAELFAQSAALWATHRASLARPRHTPRTTGGALPWQRTVTNPHLRVIASRRMAQWRGPYATLLPYLDATFGVYRVAGGMQALADAIDARCRQLGVRFTLNAPVTRITGALHVTGLELEGGQRLRVDVAVTSLPARPSRDLGGWVSAYAASTLPVDTCHHHEWVSTDERIAPVVATTAVDTRMSPDGGRSWTVRARSPRPLEELQQVSGIALQQSASWVLESVARTPPLPAPHRAARRGHYRIGAGATLGDGLPLVALAAERVAGQIGAP